MDFFHPCMVYINMFTLTSIDWYRLVTLVVKMINLQLSPYEVKIIDLLISFKCFIKNQLLLYNFKIHLSKKNNYYLIIKTVGNRCMQNNCISCNKLFEFANYITTLIWLSYFEGLFDHHLLPGFSTDLPETYIKWSGIAVRTTSRWLFVQKVDQF